MCKVFHCGDVVVVGLKWHIWIDVSVDENRVTCKQKETKCLYFVGKVINSQKLYTWVCVLLLPLYWGLPGEAGRTVCSYWPVLLYHSQRGATMMVRNEIGKEWAHKQTTCCIKWIEIKIMWWNKGFLLPYQCHILWAFQLSHYPLPQHQPQPLLMSGFSVDTFEKYHSSNLMQMYGYLHVSFVGLISKSHTV